MKWYQTVYAKVAGINAAIGLLSTLFGYLISGVNWWNDQSALPDRVTRVEAKIDSLYKGDALIKAFIEAKRMSYAVGIRVKKVFDEEKNKWIKIKQFRDFEGKLHNIYIDLELTEFYGWEQYYYIDPDTHEKIYV